MIRSARLITAFITCSTQITVTPNSARVRRTISTECSSSESLRPAMTSSSRIRRGTPASWRAISTKRCSWRLRLFTSAWARSSSSTNSSIWSARAQRFGFPHRGAAEQGAEGHVLADGHRFERPGGLEHDGDAGVAGLVGFETADVPAGQGDRTLGGGVHAADHLEQGALAGTVRADEGEDLTLVDRERHVGDRREPSEELLDPGELQNGHVGYDGS